MSKRLGHERIVGLQMLRFFAAFSVLFGHTLDKAVSFDFVSDEDIQSLIALPWGYGVDIFFVISGFIMYFTSQAQFALPGAPRRFIARRFVRVVPMYWFFTAATLISMLAFGGSMSNGEIDARRTIASFAFFPMRDTRGDFRPVLALGWTLNYEVFFYLLFAVALFLPARRGLTMLLAVFMLLTAIHPLVGPIAAPPDFWTDPIILEFLVGVGVGMLRRRFAIRTRRLCWAMIVAGVVGLVAASEITLAGEYAHMIRVSLPAAVLVSGFAFLPVAGTNSAERALIFGGDASYALYLSHPFAITAAAILFRHLTGAPVWVFVTVAVVSAIAGAAAVHVVIERPTTQWLTTRLLPPGSPTPLPQQPLPTGHPDPDPTSDAARPSG